MRTELIQDNQKVSEAKMRGKVHKVLYQRSKKQSIQKVNFKKNYVKQNKPRTNKSQSSDVFKIRKMILNINNNKRISYKNQD